MEHHIDRIVQPQLRLLHQELGECPSQTSSKGRDEEKIESEQIELSSLIGEHDESDCDHQYNAHK